MHEHGVTIWDNELDLSLGDWYRSDLIGDHFRHENNTPIRSRLQGTEGVATRYLGRETIGEDRRPSTSIAVNESACRGNALPVTLASSFTLRA